MIVIENHASRCFEKFFVAFGMRDVFYLIYFEPFIFKDFEDVCPALYTAVWRKHRVKNHLAVVMKTHPVIWENRIWRMGIQCIFYRNYPNAFASELFCKSVELVKSFQLRIHILLVGLEIIVFRGLRIKSESDRFYHQNSAGCLHCKGFCSLKLGKNT